MIIGDCWIQSCCEWKNRQQNDICGLDTTPLSLTDKMKSIYTETSLHKSFSKINPEVTYVNNL